jgi:thioredoxin-like negative regulator of GroEL
MDTPPAPALHVACLCAAWCRTCDAYAAVFEQAMAALREQHPGLQAHWIDIEDEADLLGDLDVETFPTLVVVKDGRLRFAGPLTPQPETLQRVLRAALQADPPAAAEPAEPAEPAEAAAKAFARRLLQRRP